MADVVDKLRWLSSPGGEHMDDGPRLTEFCHVGNKAADEIAKLREALEWAAVQLGNNNLPAFAHQVRAVLGGDND